MSVLSIYFAQYYSLLEKLSAVTAVLILISSVDDLFIDAWYWVRLVYRRLTLVSSNRYKPLTESDLKARAQQPLAVMVPAWMEYDVISQMIETMVGVLDYKNYVIFVGTYANDAATIAEVERMRRRYRQLRRVEVPHAGPTCKADCLNWVIQAIFAYEKEEDMEFAGMVLHDSEDILHPLEFRFFNYLLPRKDMIQLPVMSLEREWYELVAGTYMDEFAECHAKDLVVRESVSGVVPSAGVGTCFSRRAMVALSEQNTNQPFNTDSLTEDYDVGTRLGKMGMQSIFARFDVQYNARRKSWFGLGRMREMVLTMPLCVREYFPDTLRTAYRQKARWVLGIGLQSWEQIGWGGTLVTKYLLFRDRKGVVTAIVSIFAYLLLLQFMAFYVAHLMGWWHLRFPPIFREGSWLMAVAQCAAVALGLRVIQRFYFVARLYGWEHGLMAIPRMVVGNVINFLAVMRAWRIFMIYLLFGKRMAWDKTMHDFPSASLLSRSRIRLGELLNSWQAIDSARLETALRDQRQHNMPLGRILLSKGWLDDETLAEAISFQSDLPRVSLNMAQVQEHAGLLPLELAIRWRALAIGRDAKEGVLIAVTNPLPDEALAAIGAAVDAPIAQRIVRESALVAALRLLRRADGDGDVSLNAMPASGAVPLLGDILIERNLVSRQAFDAALAVYRPHADGRIGDYLVGLGVVSRAGIEQAVREQRQRTMASQAGDAAAASPGALPGSLAGAT